MRRASGVQSGFTLIEILVALGLLMIGLTVVAGMFAAGLDQLRSARLRAEAGDALPQVLDDLEGRLKDRVHRQINQYVLEWIEGAAGRDFAPGDNPLPPLIESHDQIAVAGLEDLRYTFAAAQVAGRALRYLTEIDLHWRIRGKRSSRRMRTVFELRPSLVQRYLEKNLEYQVPSDK